jgi:hypothetical protein
MSVSALKPPVRSAGYINLVPQPRRAARAGSPAGVPDIVAVALCCAMGFVISVPFLPSLSSTMVDPHTFSFLVGLLG